MPDQAMPKNMAMNNINTIPGNPGHHMDAEDVGKDDDYHTWITMRKPSLNTLPIRIEERLIGVALILSR